MIINFLTVKNLLSNRNLSMIKKLISQHFKGPIIYTFKFSINTFNLFWNL